MLADPRSQALVEQLRRPVAAAAQPRRRAARPDGCFPNFDDSLRAGVPARDRALLRQHPARESQRDRAADGRLHVRQRAAGAALRHPGRLRQPVPARDAHRREPPRPARSGQHPDGHVAPNRTSPVLRGKWILENLLGTPPPPPPAERARARGGRARQSRQRADDARAHGAAPRATRSAPAATR